MKRAMHVVEFGLCYSKAQGTSATSKKVNGVKAAVKKAPAGNGVLLYIVLILYLHSFSK